MEKDYGALGRRSCLFSDYRSAGALLPSEKVPQSAADAYQHVWFLSHPEALTADPGERRRFIHSFITGALVRGRNRARRTAQHGEEASAMKPKELIDAGLVVLGAVVPW